jgi:hypothetical protein
MKTNPLARRLVKIRLLLTCLTITAVAIVEFGVGQSLAKRVGQNSVAQNQTWQPPQLTLDDWMVEAWQGRTPALD